MSAQQLPVLAEAAPARPYAGASVVPRQPVRIAVVGPDGVGKSTAIAALVAWFRANVPEVSIETRQWRPALLPDLGRYLGKPPQPKTKTPPRRKPGAFQWIRMLYYLADFVAGAWWRDRIQPAPSTLIIYDRCALDMFVDPVRFALRSRRGTRLFARLAPKADAVVLLHDSPERIAARKRELEPQEMADQLNLWLRLVEAGEICASILVDEAAPEIAARLLDITLDTIVRKNGAAPAERESLPKPVTPQGSLAWLGQILAGGCPNAALSAEHKPGGMELARYLVLPSLRNPRFLIPAGERRSTAHGLEIYNAQAAHARIVKNLLGAALRAGVAQPLWRSRASLWASSEAGCSSLLDHIAQVLDSGPLVCSISMGTPNRSQKPVLQLMDSSGRIAGYAKIGWNERTIGLARNEHWTLEAVSGVRFPSAIVPRVLHAGAWRDLYVLVESAPSHAIRQAPSRLDWRHLEFLIQLHRLGASRGRLPWSSFSADTRDRLETIGRTGFHYHAHLLEAGIRFCAAALDGEAVPLGFGHGDFAAWNIRLEREKLLVLDWEYGAPECPPLWDLLRFEIHGAIELEKKTAAAIHRKLTRAGATRDAIEAYCRALEVPLRHVDALIASYLCDALSANLLLHGALPSPKDGSTRATLANLLAIFCLPGEYRP